MIHSVVFFTIAVRSLATTPATTPLWEQKTHLSFTIALLFIYAGVTSALAQLTRMSRAPLEKLYFGFCVSSASVGLLRLVVGDPVPHVAQMVRVLMLGAGVATGMVIVRTHSMLETDLTNE